MQFYFLPEQKKSRLNKIIFSFEIKFNFTRERAKKKKRRR